MLVNWENNCTSLDLVRVVRMPSLWMVTARPKQLGSKLAIFAVCGLVSGTTPSTLSNNPVPLIIELSSSLGATSAICSSEHEAQETQNMAGIVAGMGQPTATDRHTKGFV